MSIPPPPPSSPGPYPQSGPYGQPGQPGPYGGPQGWHVPPQMPLTPQKTNPLGIVAFVMSIVCGLPLVPLILGIVALSQIRNRGEKGKGFAIAAIVIHSAAIVFYALVLILGLSGVLDRGGSAPKRDTSGQVTSPGSSEVQDIRKGDCFNTDDDLTEYNDKEGGQAFSVRIVPCDQVHEAEAYAVFDVEDGPYPGAEKFISIAKEKCAGTALTDYVGDAAKLPETLDVYYYHPQVTSWTFGDREVTCFLGNTSGASSTGSVRATGS